MARKNAKKSTVVASKTQRGRKKSKGSTSVSRRVNDPKRAKLKSFPLPSDSSSSDDMDEDYVEFLRLMIPKSSTLVVMLLEKKADLSLLWSLKRRQPSPRE
jgi:hypothetical protein